MSVRKDLFNRISNMQSDSDGWIVVSTAELADDLKRDPALISKMLNSLKNTGNIETMKDEESSRVKAVRILKSIRGYARNGARRAGRTRTTAGTQVAVNSRIVSTPNTDEYAAKKEAYQKVADQLGEYASMEWHANPLAEEALALKKRAELLASKVAELSSQNGSMTRELEYLRKAQDQSLRQGLKSAGVLVEHGS